MSEAPLIVLPDATTRSKQTIAADPKVSAWVSANAGSGKTYVLATRVIRLLLDRVDPSKLLCLTFTKTAAAEMKSRVFERLGAWVVMDDKTLADQLAQIEGKRPGAAKLQFARTLFAMALEAPGGLKIQTIHAFCEALLHRFPLEANIAGHFDLLDDFGAQTLMAEARQHVLSGGDRPGQLIEAVDDVLTQEGEAAFAELISSIIAKRRLLWDFLQDKPENAALARLYADAFGLEMGSNRATIIARAWPLAWFNPENLERIEAHEANEKRATIRDMARAIGAAGAIDDPEARLQALTKAFLKGNATTGFGHRTQHLFPDNIVAAIPDYPGAHQAAAAQLMKIHDDLNKLEDVTQTVRMLIIAQALIARYEELKRTRGYLDFDDLIARTAGMLRRAGTGAWVRYKLDQGIDHILVDEAQDTSPLQWEVVKTFADEFFDGEAARTADRTVFAVGDEKQSIYSFQGADPAGFSAARGHFNAKVSGAAKPFEPVPLDRSFRSTGNVLAAVDLVFENDTNVDGLTQSGGYQRHTALRTDTAGRVLVWNVHLSDPDPDMPADWAEPVDAPAKGARTLAQRMATTIARLLAGDEPMPVQGRQAAAGDILVLVRKRGPFVGELSRALKTLQVPVAGADRLILTAHIATMDLLALGKCLLNEHDELSLAAVLKSPLFGLGDDDLMALCFDRDDITLWQQLGSSAKPSHRNAFDELSALRTLLETRSAFDFYAHVLTALDGRQKMIARLNPETADILDEFMALAEAFERDHTGHLHLFIDHVERHAPEIKREMEQGADAVRVMTVHGAKGLEAPIVFLVDDCTAPHNAAQMDKIVTVASTLVNDVDRPVLPAWYRGRPRSSVMETVAVQSQAAAEAEYRRLLYVGMTRAADVLFVVGHTTKEEAPSPGDLRWHQMVDDALRDHAKPMETDDGTVLAFPNADPAQPAPSGRDARSGPADNPVDGNYLAQIREKAPHEPPPKRPLMPSGATSFAIEATQPPTENEVIRPISLLDAMSAGFGSAANAAVRGSALHILLQMLPDVAKSARDALARSWLSQNGFAPGDHDVLLAEVFSVIDDPAYAFLFSPLSQAEVQLMGTVLVEGEERAVSGVIDRIAVTDEKVTIVDYKTGRPPPDKKAPDIGVYQLALYGALASQIYPGRAIETLLLYTRGPLMIDVGERDRERALIDLAEA